MRNIQLIKQPTGITCGPTCLRMLYDTIMSNVDSNKPAPNIKMIADWCGTDDKVGTPPDRMEKGMKELRIKYVEYIGSPKPYDLLSEVLESGNFGLLRTITKGVPHWIIAECVSTSDGIKTFGIMDPWLGEINYTIPELESIWKQRQYQFFEIIMK